MEQEQKRSDLGRLTRTLTNPGGLPERGSFSPQAAFDISLLTVCLGGELPLLVLPEPALWRRSGCGLLDPGCDLPDPVVSDHPHPSQAQYGVAGPVCKGTPMPRLSRAPCTFCLLGPVLPDLRST